MPDCLAGEGDPIGKFFIRKVANFDACGLERLYCTGLNRNLRILKVGIGSRCSYLDCLPLLS